MDGAWHREHPLPRDATLEQRVEWHREHQRVCACREPPREIAAMLAADDLARHDADPSAPADG